MLWKNRGQELALFEERFKGKRNIVFYGLSWEMQMIYERLSFLQIDFAFSQDKYYGEDLKSVPGGGIIGGFMDAVSLMKDRNYLLIIALTNPYERNEVKKRMVLSGYQENVDFFDSSVFLSIYLPIYILCAHGKCYIEYLNHPINWKCTLKCKKCAACIPYVNHENAELSVLNAETDLLFEKVDFVQRYDFTGGEAFLVQNLLLERMKYLLDNYSDCFGKIECVTNATVMPNQEILDFIYKNQDRIVIYASNYPHLPGWQDKFDCFMNKFSARGISLSRTLDEKWMDFGFDEEINLALSPKELTEYFDLCPQNCRMYDNGNLAYCADSYDAQMAFYPDIDQRQEMLNLKSQEVTKEEIIELFLGFQEKGYIEMCRHCNGWGSRNKKCVPVAEQL